jgi:hypothetical protein
VTAPRFVSDAVEQLAVGISERFDAFALDLAGDARQINSRRVSVRQDSGRGSGISGEGGCHVAVIGESAQRVLGHRAARPGIPPALAFSVPPRNNGGHLRGGLWQWYMHRQLWVYGG